jgi:hypothetical protein
VVDPVFACIPIATVPADAVAIAFFHRLDPALLIEMKATLLPGAEPSQGFRASGSVGTRRPNEAVRTSRAARCGTDELDASTEPCRHRSWTKRTTSRCVGLVGRLRGQPLA